MRHPLPALLCLFALAGCATSPGTREHENNDPFEPANRVVFNANDAIDAGLIKPIADAAHAKLRQSQLEIENLEKAVG